MSDTLKIGVTCDHAAALAAYTAAGHTYPEIPAGRNTVWHHFVTADGHPAAIINQRGFAPQASDNEEQCNGCTLAVALDAADNPTTRASLDRWITQMLETK